MNNSTTTVINRISARWFLLVFWLLTFVIYIATARAGWVIDGVGFLYNEAPGFLGFHQPYLFPGSEFLSGTHASLLYIL